MLTKIEAAIVIGGHPYLTDASVGAAVNLLESIVGQAATTTSSQIQCADYRVLQISGASKFLDFLSGGSRAMLDAEHPDRRKGTQAHLTAAGIRMCDELVRMSEAWRVLVDSVDDTLTLTFIRRS